MEIVFGIGNPTKNNDTFCIVIKLINESDLDSAFSILRMFPLDTIKHSGYFGFTPKNLLDSRLNYLMFRYEEAKQNLPSEGLQGMIVKSAIDESTMFQKLNLVEQLHTSNLNEKNKEKAKSIIELSDQISKENNIHANRLHFLKAYSYNILGDVELAIEIYQSLIKEGYYEMISLKAIIGIYLNKKDTASAGKFMDIFKSRFPDEPLITSVDYKSSEKDILELKGKCEQRNRQRDLIILNTILARHLLYTKQIGRLEKMVSSYEDSFKLITATDFYVKFERGVFFDIKMRLLFLNGKFKELCEFALTELRDNPVISISSENEFKVYIQSLYQEYNLNSPEDFEKFFNLNFQECI
jgi:hypothetical protein